MNDQQGGAWCVTRAVGFETDRFALQPFGEGIDSQCQHRPLHTPYELARGVLRGRLALRLS
jgi:hypothetical protein